MRHRQAPTPAHRTALLAARAALMRHAPTDSEARLWRELRGGSLGVVFRRQVPLLGRYIADFAAPAARLVVEVDGASHTGRERADARRDRALEQEGWRVVRVAPEDVARDLPGVVARVRGGLGR